MPNPKNTGTTTRDVNAAIRAQAAIKLYAEGLHSWEDIAAQAGYGSRGAAHHAVMRELQRCITHDVEELRDKQLYMLGTLQARCFKEATDAKNDSWQWSVDRCVTISKRLSELMGLDIAKEQAVAANMVVVREMPAAYLGDGKE